MKTVIQSILSLLLLVSAASFAGKVDINSADATVIATELKGVGEAKALAIVAYREANGPFKSADDLSQVKGIGDRTVEINRENIVVGGKAE